MHPLYFTLDDFRQKLRAGDPVVAGMVRACAVVSGAERFVQEVGSVQG